MRTVANILNTVGEFSDKARDLTIYHEQIELIQEHVIKFLIHGSKSI